MHGCCEQDAHKSEPLIDPDRLIAGQAGEHRPQLWLRSALRVGLPVTDAQSRCDSVTAAGCCAEERLRRIALRPGGEPLGCVQPRLHGPIIDRQRRRRTTCRVRPSRFVDGRPLAEAKARRRTRRLTDGSDTGRPHAIRLDGRMA